MLKVVYKMCKGLRHLVLRKLWFCAVVTLYAVDKLRSELMFRTY